MDLILWRHAEAHELSEKSELSKLEQDDLARPLTARGIKQAQRMGSWLDQHMPSETRIVCSPALRCTSTADALNRKFKICPELAPDQDDVALLELANWPQAKHPVLVIGHQPNLGLVMGRLLGWQGHALSVRKGSLWWLRSRLRLGQRQTIVHCVQTPDMIW